ncbi:MAG: magnesium transporter [Rhodospirillaceae bacterium]|jgi:magnesium transporter|nr:magnesium transporter [Rhodospirillaceae bacterium]
MAMVVNSAAYEDGRRVADIDIDRLDQWPNKDGRVIWIGLHEPDAALLTKLQHRFGLHDLAIEDAHQAHQRPKLEVYGDSLFLVLRTAQLVDGNIQFGETHIFAGRGYVISIRHGPSVSYAEVRRRCEQAPQMLKKGEDFIVYALMDFVVDNYFPIVTAMQDEVSAIEGRIFQDTFDHQTVEHIYELRSNLLTLRNVVSPLVEICNRMIRFDVPLIDRDTHLYFRDVYDHALKVNEGIDTQRELLTSALEANLLLSSVRQNEVMKKLGAWGAILAVPTAIAGIYGMNFQNMPELHWRFGYPIIMFVIIGICGLLYSRFKRSGWI